MIMDIRNFFSASGSKEAITKSKSTTSQSSKAVPARIPTKKRSVAASKTKTRRRKVVFSDSDSDEVVKTQLVGDPDSDIEILDASSDSGKNNGKKAKVASKDEANSNTKNNINGSERQNEEQEKKETVNLADYFKNDPVKRSSFRNVQQKLSPAKKNEEGEDHFSDMLEIDEDFERTLIQIDLTSHYPHVSSKAIAKLNSLKEKEVKIGECEESDFTSKKDATTREEAADIIEPKAKKMKLESPTKKQVPELYLNPGMTESGLLTMPVHSSKTKEKKKLKHRVVEVQEKGESRSKPTVPTKIKVAQDLDESVKGVSSTTLHSSKTEKDKNVDRPLHSQQRDQLKASSSESLPVVAESKSGAGFMWVDKYKPSSLKQVIGQQGDKSNAKKLLEWLNKWQSNRNKPKGNKAFNRWADDGSNFKVVLLSGPPGVGKTTTAQLACKEAGFEFMELNASDTRSKKTLQQEVAQLLTNQTLSLFDQGTVLSKKHCIIMDEVDGMSGNEDRGGTQELIALLKKTRIPIICICNNRQHPKIRSLSFHCFDLRFQKPRLEQIKGAMLSIAHKEGVKVSGEVLNEIIQASQQDVRQVLHNLSLFAASKKQPTSDNKTHSTRPNKDVKLGPFEVLRSVFAVEEASSSIHSKCNLFFHDYSLSPLFVQENYLHIKPFEIKADVSKHLQMISKAADSIRDGDLVDKIIRTRNNWSLLPLQALYSSVRPGDFLRGHMSGMINFPSWLGKNSKRKHMDRVLQQLHMHMKLRISANKTEVNLNYVPLLRDALTRPLLEEGGQGVGKVIEVMAKYYLIREDADIVGELHKWSTNKDVMADIPPKVKAALTRAFNKESMMSPYATISNPKKGKARTGSKGDSEAFEEGNDDLEEGNDDLEEGESDEERTLNNDAMIKKRVLKKKDSDVSIDSPCKGKGRGKKTSRRGAKK